MMAFFQRMRSPSLSFFQTVMSLLLNTVALMSSFWCVGKQKVPKPLCTATKHTHCIPVPGVSNTSNIQFFWETGDDRFVFPTFHTGLFVICEENIYADTWEEKCRGFYTLTPGDEKAMMWLSLSMELVYIGLLLISCTLLSVQLCIRAWFPSTLRWGQMLNAFAAIFTVLGGLLGMVGHMMFMQVFQTTASMGPEDFKPHSYGYSWAFYVAWLAFTICMAAGVSTLNNYTKKVLMVGPRRTSDLNPCSFNFVGLLPPAPYYTPPNPAISLSAPLSAPIISHLSPYYEPPSAASPPTSSPRLTHSQSLPLTLSDTFPLPPSHPAPSSPYHRLSLPSPSPSPVPSRYDTTGHKDCFDREEDYSPL
ncbi:germ cell-specific gene 1-like protein [Austrofundulus limnaeus]|uniref:Germ cell-specific gene 1-like protein n=1 Tax=Austrofundulus limnaeus TaxID=52670 RepID=A0A2I4BKY1_AUSLI|nr:PREDICTED: germ cell-specific gene 1 protein [Austrofundulus limnaeus]